MEWLNGKNEAAITNEVYLKPPCFDTKRFMDPVYIPEKLKPKIPKSPSKLNP